ncbi:YeiH family protein [Helicobacter sp. MIT 05-5294]|uniref:YeiH family protein n=1 Tax=Helicobacter sp. MIT 05-5294 TaxID=1548150 RepID=UPI0010FE28C5|nr:YeiH family protein [Helicobacter sp. MIT 05-5294]TLD87014.1 YeiH family putative sulfate export transporter [Helicobacter sp. MIT 05-5294]
MKQSLKNPIKSFLNEWFYGFALVLLVSLFSFFLASLLTQFFLSPLIIGVVFGILASPIFRKTQNKCEKAVVFSAKKLLRAGIILYGFNVTLQSIAFVGFNGILLSLFVVVFILSVGYFLGVKILKLDKEIAILVSGGSAICGAAAVLALESSLKSQPYKGIIAVGTVVVFGLLGMFLYPILYSLDWIPLSLTQEGYYIGLTLHELANVVGAGGTISQETQEIALIVKMIRVLLLVPVLLVIPYFLRKKKESEKLHIPWFAFWFLAVVLTHSFFAFPDEWVSFFRFLSGFFLVMAMSALGLQVDLKKFLESGGKAFGLAFVLFGILMVGGFFLVYCFVPFI